MTYVVLGEILCDEAEEIINAKRKSKTILIAMICLLIYQTKMPGRMTGADINENI